MKVRMKVSMSGTLNGRAWPARGGVVELTDAQGAKLCAAGLAEPVTEHPAPVETATAKQPVETRQQPPAKRGRPRLPRDADGNVIQD